MTDMTEFLPGSQPVPLGQFLLAAFLTPLAVGLGGAIFVMPAFAAYWGLPAYALLGLPMFWLTIRLCPDAVRREAALPFAIAGLAANLGTYPLYLVGGTLLEHRRPDEWAQFCAAFGMFFGPAHGMVFAEIYYLVRAKPKRPHGLGRIFTSS